MTFDLKTILPLGIEVEAVPSRHPHDVYLSLLCIGRRALDEIVRELPPSLQRFDSLPQLAHRAVWSKVLLDAADTYGRENEIVETPAMSDAYQRAFEKNMRLIYPNFRIKQTP